MKKHKILIPTLLVGCCAMLTLAGCGEAEKDTEVKIESQTKSGLDDSESKNNTENSADKNITSATPTQVPTPTEIPLEAKEFVAIDNVNVRRAPTTDGEIIDSFATGDHVKVIGIENDVLEKQGGTDKWYKVKLYEGTANEIEGYVSMKYVNQVHKKNGSISSNTDDTETVSDDAMTNARNSANEKYAEKAATATPDLNRENVNDQNQQPITESDTDSQSRYANPLGE